MLLRQWMFSPNPLTSLIQFSNPNWREICYIVLPQNKTKWGCGRKMNIFWEDILKLGLAILLGGVIGLEREWNTKSGGFRTLTLISLGSALFTMASVRVLGQDASRVVSTIVQGVGFLGAGILINDAGKVRGVTTAAAIWVVAALGAGIGLGYYAITVIAGVMVLFILTELKFLKSWFDRPRRIHKYKVVFPLDREIHADVAKKAQSLGLTILRQSLGKQSGQLVCTWELRGGEPFHDAFTQYLMDADEVLEFQFEVE
jgi:putative Mg2+ transporter-C (MgtC) family protein